MLMEMLVGGWLVKSCLISGEVIWNANHSTAALAAECPVRYEIDRTRLRIRSKKWMVEILIPEEEGIQSFQYRWGQTKAVIGDHVVDVSYGPAGEV